MTEESTLVTALKRKQRELGLSDVRFSKKLGVDRRMWSFIKTGELQPGRRTLRGVRQSFPELIPELLDFFLPQNESQLESNASQAPVEAPA